MKAMYISKTVPFRTLFKMSRYDTEHGVIFLEKKPKIRENE
jgi:hypothetical protein